MRVYWQIGNYGEGDDCLLRALIRFMRKIIRANKNRKEIKFRIKI